MAGFGVRSATAVRLIPHPAVTLALEFGAGQPIVRDNAGRQQRGSIVAGLGFGCDGPIQARGENIECLQIRLSPIIAPAILGVSPTELGDAVVTLDDLWSQRAAERIRERLSESANWEARFALATAFITGRLTDYDRTGVDRSEYGRAGRGWAGSRADPEVAWVWRRIVRGRGRIRVDGLAAEVGWSRKRLWSRFGAQIGLPPKAAAKLVRFDHAAHRLAAGQPAAAADSGYADQSHLHRDVLALTEDTPAAIAAEPWLAIDDVAWPATRRLKPIG